MYLPLQCGINIRFISSYGFCVGSYCVKTVCGVLRAASLATPFEIFSHCVDLKASNKHLRPLHLPCLCASAQNLYECYLGRKEKKLCRLHKSNSKSTSKDGSSPKCRLLLRPIAKVERAPAASTSLEDCPVSLPQRRSKICPCVCHESAATHTR